MSIDTAAILAEQYKANPNALKAAVLGQGSNINPYAALRALQLQKVAERYEMMQAALAGQQAGNQPSMVEQAVAPTMPQMPQQGGGLPQMQQPQQASQGLAGMPAPEGEYAAGGIVAFAEGGESDDPYGEDLTAAFANNQIASGGIDAEDLMPSPGDPRTHAQLTGMVGPILRDIRSQEYVPFTEAQRKAAIASSRQALQEGAGEDPAVAYRQQLEQLGAQGTKDMEQASGYGLLAAAGDILQPGGLYAGIGRAAKTYGGAMQQASAAKKAEDRALMQMKFQIADAQRKERMGLTRDAMSMAQQAQKSHEAAQIAKQRRLIAEGKMVTDAMRATKPTGGGAGGAKEPKDFSNQTALTLFQDMKADPQYKGIPDARLKALAYKEAANITGKIPGAEAGDIKREAADTARGNEINKELVKKQYSTEGLKAAKEGRLDKYLDEQRTELEKSYRTRNKKSSETEKSDKVGGKGSRDYTNLFAGPND